MGVGVGSRPESPDHELKPFRFGMSYPAQFFSQQQEYGAPAALHAGGATETGSTESQFHAMQFSSAQHAASHAV